MPSPAAYRRRYTNRFTNQSDSADTAIQSNIPCIIGRGPVLRMAARERLVPMRNRVTFSPVLARDTHSSEIAIGSSEAFRVREAARKRPMK